MKSFGKLSIFLNQFETSLEQLIVKCGQCPIIIQMSKEQGGGGVICSALESKNDKTDPTEDKTLPEGWKAKTILN